MLDRVHVEKILESWESEATYRVCEASGELCDCWLPGYENRDPEGCLDRGGFDRYDDAQAFALGVDRERGSISTRSLGSAERIRWTTSQRERWSSLIALPDRQQPLR